MLHPSAGRRMPLAGSTPASRPYARGMDGHPPAGGDQAHEVSREAETVLAILERNRGTFAWKTSGLSPSGLAATTAASSMTLGGLVKHMALVEVDWLAVKLAGEPYGEPWDSVDFDADPDWEWRTGATDSPAALDTLWKAAVARSRRIVDRILHERGMDGPANWMTGEGASPTVREMLMDMIEEYARHTGHADILRESVDGLVGEGPPSTFPP